MEDYSRYDPSFTAEISNKMQVPKHIRMGDSDKEDDFTPNGTYVTGSPRFDMNVPDRIVVVGQEKHLASKAPPRELLLENSILPPDKQTIRVQTPPRTITVDQLSFARPAEASHDPVDSIRHEESEESDAGEYGATAVLETNQPINSRNNDPNASLMSLDSAPLVLTPPQLTEEVYVLRQQVGRLHRRMAAMEREQHYRQQRDALVVSVGVVYFVWKILLWLTRN
nr:EOG090X08OG [Eulimnadia texana]